MDASSFQEGAVSPAVKIGVIDYLGTGIKRNVVLASKMAALRPVYSVDGIGNFELARTDGDYAFVAKLSLPKMRSYVLVTPSGTQLKRNQPEYLSTRVLADIAAKTLRLDAYVLNERADAAMREHAAKMGAYNMALGRVVVTLIDRTYTKKNGGVGKIVDWEVNGHAGEVLTPAAQRALREYGEPIAAAGIWPTYTAAELQTLISALEKPPAYGFAHHESGVAVSAAAPVNVSISDDDVDLNTP